MYQNVFLFNGVGSKYEKLLAGLTPELNDCYQGYFEAACERIGLCKDIEQNTGYDRRIVEWLVPFVCNRVIYEQLLHRGIVPDLGIGYSSGIVSAVACFGAISHEDEYAIVSSHRSMLKMLDDSGEQLDTGIIVGFSRDDLSQLLEAHFTSEELVIGSSNSSFHSMITGKAAAVEQAVALCVQEGALKAFRLGTGTAFHHKIMQTYSKDSIAICRGLIYHDPVYPMISVFDQRVLQTAADVARENQINIYTPMRWDLALKTAEQLGATTFYDLSANGSLSKISRVGRKCKIYTCKEIFY